MLKSLLVKTSLGYENEFLCFSASRNKHFFNMNQENAVL